MEGGNLRVGEKDPQVIPPLSSGGLPLEGKRRMVPLEFINRKVLIQGDHIHAWGAADEVSGAVDGAYPRFQLARPVHRHDPQKGVDHFRGGDKADGPQLGEGQLHLLPQVSGPPLLAKSTRTLGLPRVNTDELGGKVKTRCPIHHPRGSGCGCQRLGRGGYHVARAPLEEESELHRVTKAWKSAELEKKLGRFARSSREWDLHANASETSVRDMRICLRT